MTTKVKIILGFTLMIMFMMVLAVVGYNRKVLHKDELVPPLDGHGANVLPL